MDIIWQGKRLLTPGGAFHIGVIPVVPAGPEILFYSKNSNYGGTYVSRVDLNAELGKTVDVDWGDGNTTSHIGQGFPTNPPYYNNNTLTYTRIHPNDTIFYNSKIKLDTYDDLLGLDSHYYGINNFYINEGLGNCTKLEKLVFGSTSNMLYGNISSMFSNKLKFLDFQYQSNLVWDITNTADIFLNDCVNLALMGNSQITGTFNFLSGMTKLQILYIYNREFDLPLADDLINITGLTWIYLYPGGSGALLQGDLTNFIYNNKKLTFISISEENDVYCNVGALTGITLGNLSSVDFRNIKMTGDVAVLNNAPSNIKNNLSTLRLWVNTSSGVYSNRLYGDISNITGFTNCYSWQIMGNSAFDVYGSIESILDDYVGSSEMYFDFYQQSGITFNVNLFNNKKVYNLGFNYCKVYGDIINLSGNTATNVSLVDFGRNTGLYGELSNQNILNKCYNRVNFSYVTGLTYSTSGKTWINKDKFYGQIYLNNCGFSQTEVDYIISDIYNTALTPGGYFSFYIQGNSIPSSGSITMINTMVNTWGWTVSYDV